MFISITKDAGLRGTAVSAERGLASTGVCGAEFGSRILWRQSAWIRLNNFPRCGIRASKGVIETAPRLPLGAKTHKICVGGTYTIHSSTLVFSSVWMEHLLLVVLGVWVPTWATFFWPRANTRIITNPPGLYFSLRWDVSGTPKADGWVVSSHL